MQSVPCKLLPFVPLLEQKSTPSAAAKSIDRTKLLLSTRFKSRAFEMLHYSCNLWHAKQSSSDR
jgi:hypothetical protein